MLPMAIPAIVLALTVIAAALTGCSEAQPVQVIKPAKADCTPAKALPVGDSNHTVDFDGQKRRYRIHVQVGS